MFRNSKRIKPLSSKIARHQHVKKFALKGSTPAASTTLKLLNPA
jgi:hypothetical protein